MGLPSPASGSDGEEDTRVQQELLHFDMPGDRHGAVIRRALNSKPGDLDSSPDLASCWVPCEGHLPHLASLSS